MGPSIHPLVGLPHKCDIVRRVLADDTAGGVSESATETVVYARRTTRVSSLDPNDIQLRGYGFDPKTHMKVVAVYSPKILTADFLKVPWGVPPNVVTPVGLADGFASSYTLTVTSTISVGSPFSPILLTPPFGSVALDVSSVVLTWDGTEFTDEDGDYRVFWTGSVWRFEDLEHSVSHDFVGFSQSQNIFRRPWEVEVGSGYSVAGGGSASAMQFRIVWMKHQIDELGRYHHTSLVIQLEEPDT